MDQVGMIKYNEILAAHQAALVKGGVGTYTWAVAMAESLNNLTSEQVCKSCNGTRAIPKGGYWDHTGMTGFTFDKCKDC